MSQDEDALDEVADAFQEKTFKKGENIIKQGESLNRLLSRYGHLKSSVYPCVCLTGDPGDNFYILSEGHCDIFVAKAGGAPVKVCVCV